MTRSCGDRKGMFVRHNKDACLQLSVPGGGRMTGGANLGAHLQRACVGRLERLIFVLLESCRKGGSPSCGVTPQVSVFAG